MPSTAATADRVILYCQACQSCIDLPAGMAGWWIQGHLRPVLVAVHLAGLPGGKSGWWRRRKGIR